MIQQQGMTSSINSGGFILQTNQTKDMLNYVFNMLNRFINSNATIHLDQSFCVYFKVLSMAHVNFPGHRRGPLALVGESNSKPLKKGTIGVPEGFPANPICFVNKCLLTSVILGHFKNQEDSEVYDLLLPFCYKNNYVPILNRNKAGRFTTEYNKAEQNRAGFYLNDILRKVIEKCDIPQCGPFDLYSTLPKLANEFQCQIHVLQNFQGSKASLLSFPEDFDDSLPQIFLDNSTPSHVTLIVNLTAYFKQYNRAVCFGCKKTFSLYYRHFCQQKKVCQQCRRFLKSEKNFFYISTLI